VRQVGDILLAQYRRAYGPNAPDDPEWDAEIAGRLRRHPEVRRALERMWPVLTGGELVHDLFSFPALVRSAADGVLSRVEQDGLVRPRAASVRDVEWTEADLALIDEADALLGPPEAALPKRRARGPVDDADAARVVADFGVGGFFSASDLAARYAGASGRTAAEVDEPRTFGHVLVDEAQDLTPMQWRMIGRRCPTGSMTLVGDFGQASRPGSPPDWDAVVANLPARAGHRVVNLSVNYRAPAEVMDLAARVLAAAAPGLEPPRSVRSTGVPPQFVTASPDRLVDAAADVARAFARRTGTTVVIADVGLHDLLVAALHDVGAVADSVDALDAPVAVLDPVEAKGLEFDHVVVVEPSNLVDPDAFGLRLLYVTLTRATQRLAIVHAKPLPEMLAAGSRN
jgi:superfamily I DNA/RNA helicase